MPTYSNPYTKKVIEQQEKVEPQFLTAIDRMQMESPFVCGADNMYKTWGPWELRCTQANGCEFYELYHEAADYAIDFSEVNDMSELLDWVIHMSCKSSDVYGKDFIYFLNLAFQNIFDYSSINIVSPSFGKTPRGTGLKAAKKYYKAINKKRNVSVRTRHKVLERDGFRCQDCGASPAMGAVLEVDHTIPVSKGGTNEMSNLRTLCADCNRGKSDRIVDYS